MRVQVLRERKENEAGEKRLGWDELRKATEGSEILAASGKKSGQFNSGDDASH